MGTISARKRKDGSVAYRARVRVMQDGVTYHETETFDRRPAAAAWISKRERELSKPGAVAKSRNDEPTTLAKVLNRYTKETIKDIGRSTPDRELMKTEETDWPTICFRRCRYWLRGPIAPKLV